MLFDHDSADSLRIRAEASNQGNKNKNANHSIDVLAPGTSSSSATGSGPDANLPSRRKFGITIEDIGKFDNNVENLAKFGGVEGVARILNVDPKKGIDASLEDLISRAQQFGENTYPVSQAKPFWRYVWEALQDPTLLILVSCAVVSLVVGLTTEDPKEGWYDGGGVSFAIILVLLVSSTSNYRQSLQFRALTAENQKIMVNVTRGGKRMKIIIFELVVGDVVHLAVGDQIPGDGLLLVGNSLVVDESSMTGESEPALKDATHPFLISGCKVMDGTGSELITSVGMHTEWGKVMATLAVDNEEETPLQVRLNQLSENIGKIGITVAVTIVVVAVPEGLPLAVTLTLAYSMHKMMDDRALVRNLSACETMGSATTICSDKTGTLTMNLMTVVSSWVCGKLRASNEMDKEITKKVEERLFASVCLNTNGHVGLSAEGVVEISGSPTEVACLNWAVKLGAVFDDIQKENKIICVDTFNSTKKRMGVVIQDKDGTAWAHWKGASEVLLKQCTKYIDADGTIFDLTNSKREELEGIIMTFANAALRTLCFACKELNEREFAEVRTKKKQLDIPDRDLICLSIVGIKDPLRPGVTEAVRKCQIAGIKVRMVTGDNIMTAKAIALECGIFTEAGFAIEGKQFREMEKEEQYRIIPYLQVMARSSPTDKHMLVKRLLEMGDVVAVTGDGTNDAPALHEASIGLAMGIAGTEVAKESADIVILDDNFASIVKVVRWGRSVYSNIQKFIQFQCTVNGVALALNFIAALADGRAPLTAVQLLWVNLIMDTMGALALATEPPHDGLMLRDPVRKRDPLITNIMWRNMFGQFLYQLALLLVLHFHGKTLMGLPLDEIPSGPENLTHADKEVETVIFNAFVFCQVFNEFNARKPEEIHVLKGIFQSKIFIYVFAVTCLVQVVLVEVCGSFTSTVPLSWHRWLLCIALGLVSMPLAAAWKLVPVPKKPFLSGWQKRENLVFREGGSVMAMMFRQESTKTVKNLQKLKSVKSPKFYKEFHGDVSDDILKRVIWGPASGPSASTDVENPNKRNANEAWK